MDADESGSHVWKLSVAAVQHWAGATDSLLRPPWSFPMGGEEKWRN